MKPEREKQIRKVIIEAYDLITTSVRSGSDYIPLKDLYKTAKLIFKHSIDEFKFVLMKMSQEDWRTFYLSKCPVITADDKKYAISPCYKFLTIRKVQEEE